MDAGPGIPGPAGPRRDRRGPAQPPLAGRDRRAAGQQERIEVFIQSTAARTTIRDALGSRPEIKILQLSDVDRRSATRRAHAARRRSSRGGRMPASCAPEAGAGAGAAQRRTRGARPATATVRIDVERLDRLLNLVGELVIDRTRLIGLGRRSRIELGEHPMLSEITETRLPPRPHHRRDAGRGDEEPDAADRHRLQPLPARRPRPRRPARARRSSS